ncbi:hypothetical protein MP228_005240 [Amoeboaphelidium protococcarum]|nr:hypothetical protein MP228_005240 [Amoeboaphelidium protococcarum]
MEGTEWTSKLKTFDAYAKTKDDFKIKTSSGAIISISAIVLSTLLVIFSFIDYLQVHTESELTVDHSRRERLSIYLDITFPYMACNLLNVDVMDASGEQQNNVHHTLMKTRLDRNGKDLYSLKETLKAESASMEVLDPNYCGDCYGAPRKVNENGCCNTCDDVIQSYLLSGWSTEKLADFVQCVREKRAEPIDFNSGEGCRIHGNLMVQKVSGNFHIAPGNSFEHPQGGQHVHDLQSVIQHLDKMRFEHQINSLRFGDQVDGVVQPLDNYQRLSDLQGSIFFQYFIKVVPTQVKYLNGSVITTNQYSVTQHERAMQNGQLRFMPGLFFQYDISPMLVVYSQNKKQFSAFLTEVCAILGGIFTIAQFIDAFLFRAEKALQKKNEIGKLN